MHKYIYKNLKTGEKIYTNEKINKEGFKLVFELRSSDMKSKEINQK